MRRAVWSCGFRYRLHLASLPGTPDMVFPRYRLAVLVHGCFWHQHGCSKSKRPSSNREFWNRKLDANVARDVRDHTRLENMGWSVVVIWECSLESGTENLLMRLKRAREDIEA